MEEKKTKLRQKVTLDEPKQNFLERLFYDIREKTYLTVTVERDPDSRDGFRYDTKYYPNSEIPVPNAIEFVADIQRAMRESLEKSGREKVSFEGKSFVIAPDPFGVKRLGKYLSRYL